MYACFYSTKPRGYEATCDLWALGMILQELCTTRLAFYSECDDHQECYNRKMTETPERIDLELYG